MQKKIGHGVQRAISFIETNISSGQYQPGEKLAPVHALAKQFGVSLATMSKAIGVLKERKILRASSGHFVEVIGSPETPSKQMPPATVPEAKSLQPWEKAKNRLESDILHGRFPYGKQLPSHKELCNRYAISPATLRKVLEELSKSKLIKPHKRGYSTITPGSSSVGTDIVVIGYKGQFGDIALGRHGSDILRMLEMQCAQLRINLRIVVFALDGESISFYTAGEGKQLRTIDSQKTIGFIALANSREFSDTSVIPTVMHVRKPFAILDEIGLDIQAKSTKGFRHTRIFRTTVSRHPGEQLARFLINLGHKSIAYISPFHGSTWSQQRLRGLQSTYKAAGYSRSVAEFVADWGILEAATLENPIKNIEQEYLHWRETTSASYRKHLESVFFEFRRTANTLSKIDLFFEQHIKKLQAKTGITAWVAANDITAVVALEYLRRINRKIPRDISLVAFDDTIFGQINHLTSYNFNIHAAISAMLNYILRQRAFGELRRSGVHEIAGYIVKRDTTGKAQLRQQPFPGW